MQVCPVFVAAEEEGEAALRIALRQIAAFHRAVRQNPESVSSVAALEDLDSLAAGDRIGLMLALEGAEPLGYDVELIDVLWQLGVRMVTLTRGRGNLFADGTSERRGAGLSRLGETLVDRLAELGAIIDLAHASTRTFEDVLERAAGHTTMLVSHAACRSVFDTPHNLSDSQLKLLAEAGGVLGLMALPLVIDHEDRSLERVVDHLDHAVSIMGLTGVALGADFVYQLLSSGALQVPADTVFPPGMSPDAAIEGLRGAEDYQALVRALERRGWDEPNRRAVLHENAMRLLRRALPSENGDPTLTGRNP